MKSQYQKTIIIGFLFIILTIAAFFFINTLGNKKATPVIMQPSVISPTSGIGYTLTNIADHATQADCWMAIEGKAYNVTSFISDHPGGERILEGCGKDATALFQSVQKHIPEAIELLPTYYMGDLK